MRRFKPLLFVIIPLLVALLVGYLLRNHNFQVLNTRGVVGDKERQLMIYATLLSLAVIIPVFVMTITIATKYNERNTKARYRPDWDHNTALETLWWGLPCAIILALAVLAWQSSHQLDPYKKLVSDKKPLKVQVIALDWKWLFIYPDQGIATVNQLVVPAGTPVSFRLTSATVWNVFWVPQMGTMIYAMPRMTTRLNLQADKAGSYDGLSAHFSGDGFPGMQFKVQTLPADQFAMWAQGARGSAYKLDGPGYAQLSKPSSYVKPMTYGAVAPGLFDAIVSNRAPPSPVPSQQHNQAAPPAGV